jgi:hypothetical protein
LYQSRKTYLNSKGEKPSGGGSRFQLRIWRRWFSIRNMRLFYRILAQYFHGSFRHSTPNDICLVNLFFSFSKTSSGLFEVHWPGLADWRKIYQFFRLELIFGTVDGDGGFVGHEIVVWEF